MSNKLQNSNRIGVRINEPVRNSANRYPALSKDQVAQANHVKKLPNDFPIGNWEQMNTKQQLHAMKFSGLNPQEQWKLLNATAPLSTLQQHNQAQDEVEIRSCVARSLAPLTAQIAQPTSLKSGTPGTKSSNSTPLQTSSQLRKLDMQQEEYETRFYEKASARANSTSKPASPTKAPTAYKPLENTQPKDSGKGGGKIKEWVDNLVSLLSGGVVGRAIPEKSTPKPVASTPKPTVDAPDIVELATELPNWTPTPWLTPPPTPTPKPTLGLTPEPSVDPEIIGKIVNEERTNNNPFFLKYSQTVGDRSDCSTQVFDFYSVKEEKNPLLGSEHETCQSYYEFLHIPPKSFTSNGGLVQSSVERDNAKGVPSIPENWQSTTQFGDMAIWVKNPKFDDAGRLIKNSSEDAWHIGLCIGNEQMIDRAQWKENNPNGYEEGLFVRELDTIYSNYKLVLIIKPGEEERLSYKDLYDYLLKH